MIGAAAHVAVERQIPYRTPCVGVAAVVRRTWHHDGGQAFCLDLQAIRSYDFSRHHLVVLADQVPLGMPARRAEYSSGESDPSRGVMFLSFVQVTGSTFPAMV